MTNEQIKWIKSNNVRLTIAESEMLEAYAFCEMNSLNGGDLEYAKHAHELGTYVWLDDRPPFGMSVAQKKGVLSSLVKKGLVCVQIIKGEDDCLDFTDLGFAVAKDLFGNDPD